MRQPNRSWRVDETSRAQPGVIDLLLSDVEMPGITGISLSEQIRTERPELKVILMSGKIVDPLDSTGERLPFLRKPLDSRTLRSFLKPLVAAAARVENSKVILVVDDQLKRRERTAGILTGNGYKVITAGGREEAALLADGSSKIDLIVAAVMMDGKSGGISLAEHVDKSLRNTSTLLISHVQPALLQGLPGFLAQPEFLENPFTPEALLSRVCALLQEDAAK